MGIQIEQQEYGSLKGGNMIRDIKAVFSVKKGSLIVTFTTIVAIALIGTIIALIMGANDADVKKTTISVIGIMIISIYIFMTCFFRVILHSDETAKGIMFGMTRRKFFGLGRLFDAAEVIVLCIFECFFIGDLGAGFIVKTGIIVFALALWAQGLAGNSITRYGKAAYIVYYVLLMLLLIGGPRLISMSGSGSKIMGSFTSFMIGTTNQPAMWAAIIGLAIAGALVDWFTYRTIPVNQVPM